MNEGILYQPDENPGHLTSLIHGFQHTITLIGTMAATAQFIFISRLSLLRRVITPTVVGTVLMVVAFTVASSVFVRLPDLPAGSPSGAAPVLAGATMLSR